MKDSNRLWKSVRLETKTTDTFPDIFWFSHLLPLLSFSILYFTKLKKKFSLEFSLGFCWISSFIWEEKVIFTELSSYLRAESASVFEAFCIFHLYSPCISVLCYYFLWLFPLPFYLLIFPWYIEKLVCFEN